MLRTPDKAPHLIRGSGGGVGGSGGSGVPRPSRAFGEAGPVNLNLTSMQIAALFGPFVWAVCVRSSVLSLGRLAQIRGNGRP